MPLCAQYHGPDRRSLACRLTPPGETWSQAGEALHKRLTSAQADAAAEALRARVAHFMAAQQAAGQPAPGSMGSMAFAADALPAGVLDGASAVPPQMQSIPVSAVAADTLPPGMLDGASAAPPAMQSLPISPESTHLPSNVPGEPQFPCHLPACAAAPFCKDSQ